MKKGVYVSLLIIALLCIFGWAGQAQRQQSTRVVWEYKFVVNTLDEQRLNELGAQGWELVQFDPGVRGGGGATNESYIFKRGK
jgi:hypothetical protein